MTSLYSPDVKPAPIMLVGEAWGEHEERKGRPFVGPTGGVLKGMLRQVGINFDECSVTNVFNLRPPNGNNVTNLCGGKADGIPGRPVLQKSKYVLAKYEPELDRLAEEVTRTAPNIIVALGATPAWALLKSTGIKAIRGVPATTELDAREYKVLPTYPPRS